MVWGVMERLAMRLAWVSNLLCASCFSSLALPLIPAALTWFQRLWGAFCLFCPISTPGLPPCLLLQCCCWLPAVFELLVLEGQEESISLQLCPLLSPGDVGSFMLKLVEGLQGQTWASDWAEELQQADRQKEQSFRWGLVEWPWRVVGSQ